MKALILAAGRGQRMGSATDDKPKCLTVFRNKPLLEWQLSALHSADAEDVAIVGGYKNDMLSKYAPVPFVNTRWTESNMVRSLMCAEEWLKQGPCVVSYSDIFYNSDAVKKLMESPGDIAILYDPDWFNLWSRRFSDPLSDAETFILNGDSTVREIGSHTDSVTDVQGQYMGLLKFTPHGWSHVSEYLMGLSSDQVDKLDMTSLLSALVGQGISIMARANNSPWGEIDSGDDLRLYEEMVEQGDMVFP